MVKSERRLKLNNSGVTLIELIVVIAIISIVTGTVILGSSFLFGGREKKALSDFQSSYSEARTNTMSKKMPCDLTLSFSDKAYYLQIGGYEKEKLITNPTSIQYKTCTIAGKESELLELRGELVVSFNRATGGMNQLTIDGNDKSGVYLSELHIGNRVLYFTPDSGKYSTEKKGA